MRAASRHIMAFAMAFAALSVLACSGSDSTSPQHGGGTNNGGNGNNNGGGTPIAVARVAIAPETSFVYLGRTLGMQATPRDAAGNALSGRAISWSSSDLSKATVDAQGVVTGVALGRVIISATVDGKIGPAAIDVVPVPAASVVITPDSLALAMGATAALAAQVRDDRGAVLAGRVVTFTSSAPNVATVDSLAGVVRAVAGGVAIITASSEGKTTTVRVSVRVPVATVSVQTALDTLEAHDQLAMGAVLRDANQAVLAGRVVRWTVSNTTLATIDSITGVLTGLDRGTVTVTATSEGKVGTATRVVVIKYRSLVAGTQHSCDIASGGIVWCWGQNGNEGRIGMPLLGNTVQSSTPMYVPNTGPTGIRAAQLASFGRHTCLLDMNGKAYCWGSNAWGALGVAGISQTATPIAVSGGLTFQKIAVGSDHSCAITAAGAMYCWGHNDWRQFAANAPGMAEAPVAVAPTMTFASLSAGSGFTCGVTTTGNAMCWGYSGWGNLGDGAAISYGNTFSATPLLVIGGRTWKSIGAGQIHGCGLTTGGQTYCWGNNGGKLGNGASTESSTPVALVGAPTFASLAVGANHNCGIATNTFDVWCWGFNGSGQVGQAASTAITSPVRLAGVTAAEIAASGIGTGSGSHTCAVSVDRLTVRCWGRNDTGQLGNGATSAGATANSSPTIVIGQKPL